jgi:hypothetical protein
MAQSSESAFGGSLAAGTLQPVWHHPAMNSIDSWAWPKRPANTAEFDEMMTSLDSHLAIQGLMPQQRSLQAARLVSMALRLSGIPILGVGTARGEPFSPGDLLARVFDWYNDAYGERNKIDFSLGYVVLPLRGTYWTLQIPGAYGTVECFVDRNLGNAGRQLGTRTQPATHNVLTGLGGMTQAYANRLSDDEVGQVLNAYLRGYDAMAALDEMRGHDLFDQAKGDYRHSVDALSSGNTLGNARWDNAQCAEKIFKGLLGRVGHSFPKSGAQGHDIVHLGGLIAMNFGIIIPNSGLRAIHCPTGVRYGEINVDMNEAWTSHTALLDTLANLRSIALPLGGKRLRR